METAVFVVLTVNKAWFKSQDELKHTRRLKVKNNAKLNILKYMLNFPGEISEKQITTILD